MTSARPSGGCGPPSASWMTPEEHGEAHALLVKAATDPDWQAASQALDDLMRKLIVLHQLLEAEEHLPKRQRPADST